MILGYPIELSELIRDAHPEMAVPRECYRNAYQIAGNFLFEADEVVEVLFCFVPNRHGLYCYRHAFCLCDNQIIEPLLELEIESMDRGKIMTIRRMDFPEFRRLTLAEQGNPTLLASLHDDDMRAVRKCELPVHGNDLCEIIAQEYRQPAAGRVAVESPEPEGQVPEQTM